MLLKSNIRLMFILAVVAHLHYKVSGYRILGVFAPFGKSHFMVQHALLKGLADAGHEVTMVSAYQSNISIPNYKEIHLDGVIDKIDKERGPRNYLKVNQMFYMEMQIELYSRGSTITKLTLSHPAVQDLIASNQKFDLVVLEVFLSEALLGFGHHFNAPVIVVSPFGASKWTTDLVGLPIHGSYVPHTFSGHPDQMTFLQRMKNSLMYWFDDIAMALFYYHRQKRIYNDCFPNKTAKPSLDTLARNVSLVLLNTHVSLAFPRPYTPNMIEVGGMHIKGHIESLPNDLQTYLDDASEGAIYFSMGTNVRTGMFPVEKLNAIITALRRLKNMRILFKCENTTELAVISNNMLVRRWFPQEPILAHPNVKLFISHGGLLSLSESIYYGKPVIGIPVFGDQKLNVAQIARVGYGLGIDVADLNEESLHAAITQILNNSKFTETAKLLSLRYRDQPRSPLETAVYWVEYVIRHRGAPHLHSVAVDLPFHQLYNLDVWAVIILCFTFLTIALFKLINIARRYICMSLRISKTKIKEN